MWKWGLAMRDISQQKDYIAVSQPYRTEYTIEKSRFIASIAPCQSEAEAQAFITSTKKEFWDARHNCTAFAIGPRQEQQRSSDDGEPSGTAGKPILEVLKKTGLTNAAIVVTRYFGGIKLGAGGLIRAYSHAAALAAHRAPKQLHTLRQVLHVTLDYALYGSIERLLVDQGYSYSSDFGAQISLAVYVPPQDLDSLSEAITNATGGKAIIECGDLQEVSLPYLESDAIADEDWPVLLPSI